MRLALAALVTASWLAPARADGEGLVQAVLPAGLCRYGQHLGCCYGWRRLPGGDCEPVCKAPCVHGRCLGNNRCRCEPGFTGSTCSRDVNECGFKPRPCQYRCMNTPGSFRCYCLNGFLLLSDGTCTNSRTCALANCHHGCEEVSGAVRCLCPSPGLALGEDLRSCVDVNECRSDTAVCPADRKCVNTFGSFLCKCQTGFSLRYTKGRFECADVDECGGPAGAVGVPPCGEHAHCLNTRGSFRCRCRAGYRGNGLNCTVKPFADEEGGKEAQIPLNATGELPEGATPGAIPKSLPASGRRDPGENHLPPAEPRGGEGGGGGGGGGSESRFEPSMEKQEKVTDSGPATATAQQEDELVEEVEEEVEEVEEEDEVAFPRGDVFDLGEEEEEGEAWDWGALADIHGDDEPARRM